MGSHVEAVGTYKLVLKSGFQLDLESTFYVPSFSRNLVSVLVIDLIFMTFKLTY